MPAPALLAGYRGFLHADGGTCPRADLGPDPGAGFNGLYEPAASGPAPLVEVACRAHSRMRKVMKN